MKYTNTDLYNGFVFTISTSIKYTISNIKNESCTITSQKDGFKHSNYPLDAVTRNLNSKDWKQVETTYEIY